ncbi:hypothetical protein TNCV_3562711 [Trichonephila clavipes]|nr:hypothetical protein TNCV_3562711 [Trichonephila clavipes]
MKIKCNILLQSTEPKSKAERLVTPVTADNYPNVIEQMKERFDQWRKKDDYPLPQSQVWGPKPDLTKDLYLASQLGFGPYKVQGKEMVQFAKQISKLIFEREIFPHESIKPNELRIAPASESSENFGGRCFFPLTRYCKYYDESLEILNISELPVLIPRCDGNLKIKVEILEITHVYNANTGADIFDTVMKVLKKYKSPLGKAGKGTNLEIYKLFKQPDIVKSIAIRRLRWEGHVMLDDNRIKKKDHMYVDKPYGTRKRGSAKLRWIDCLEKDLNTINVRNWKSQENNRTPWNRILRKAKSLGCRAIEEGRIQPQLGLQPPI